MSTVAPLTMFMIRVTPPPLIVRLLAPGPVIVRAPVMSGRGVASVMVAG